jgi:glycine hydroxymethyltransferase
MAEGLFRAMVKDDPKIEVTSAGLSALDGMPPSQYSIDVLAEEGIDISDQQSLQLTPEMVEQSTHIFAMTQGHKAAIESYFPSAAEKTFLLREFTEGSTPKMAAQGFLDVPDPIGLDRSAYELTRDLIKEVLPAVVAFVRNTGD